MLQILSCVSTESLAQFEEMHANVAGGERSPLRYEVFSESPLSDCLCNKERALLHSPSQEFLRNSTNSFTTLVFMFIQFVHTYVYVYTLLKVLNQALLRHRQNFPSISLAPLSEKTQIISNPIWVCHSSSILLSAAESHYGCGQLFQVVLKHLGIFRDHCYQRHHHIYMSWRQNPKQYKNGKYVFTQYSHALWW